MIDTGIFSKPHLSHLKQALDVYSHRHKVTADNIANVESDGYRTREYRFEDLLAGADRRLAGARTHDGHLPVGARRVEETEGEIRETDTDFDNGVNNVDIDREMTDLATNDLSYRLATRLLSMQYGMLRSAIRGRTG